MSRSRALPVIAACIAACIGLLALTACSGADSEADSGFVAGDGSLVVIDEAQRKPAPDISGTTLDGEQFSLSALAGNITVLNVWASWCAPCRAEAPILEKVWKAQQSNGVRVIGLDTRDSDTSARAFVRRFGITFPNVIDRDGALQLRFSDTLPPQAIPSTIVIDAAADGIRVAHEVDGIAGPSRAVKTPAKGSGKTKQAEVWADAPPLDAAIGNGAVAVLRTIAGADAAKLSGEKDAGFTIEVDGKKRPCRLSTRATKTSKQIIITLEIPPFAPKKLEDLGMSGAMASRVRALMALEKGLFVVSSPPATGCSTTFDMVLLSTDRLLRDFVSIEDSGSQHEEVQNIKPVRYSALAGEAPLTALKAAMLEYPRAIVTRDLLDKDLAGKLVELAGDQQLVIVSLPATDAIDAVQKLLDMGIPRDQLARCLLGSLSQKLIRKLCTKCGDPLPTPPELLQRLKKTAEELPEIKRASPHGGCRFCAGRQFIGRTAIYELAAGPTLRQAIAQQVDGKSLKQAAVKDGMRPLSDEGLAVVATGLTSLDEVQRVFSAKKEAGAVAGSKPVSQPGAKPGIKPVIKPGTKPGPKPETKPGTKR
jgi:thiol-disulfide isomerase/thioredoxin